MTLSELVLKLFLVIIEDPKLANAKIKIDIDSHYFTPNDPEFVGVHPESMKSVRLVFGRD